MRYMAACEFARSPRYLTFTMGWIHKQCGSYESISAQAAFAGCLYDVHQQSICRPKDPGNGGSTTIGFNWRCKGRAAYCMYVSDP